MTAVILIGWWLCKMRKTEQPWGETSPDLYLKTWPWNLESGMSRLGCQGQWYGLLQQAFGSSASVCSNFSSCGNDLDRSFHFCSGESLVFQAELLNEQESEQFPYLFKGTISHRDVMNHGKTQIRIRMHTAHFSDFKCFFFFNWTYCGFSLFE